MAIIKFKDTTKAAVLGQIRTDIDAGGAAGKLRIYSGTVPATPETPAAGVLLAELTLGSLAHQPRQAVCLRLTRLRRTRRLMPRRRRQEVRQRHAETAIGERLY